MDTNHVEGTQISLPKINEEGELLSLQKKLEFRDSYVMKLVYHDYHQQKI